MLLSLPDLIQDYSLDIRGVIHVGAHFGEEYQQYADSCVNEMVFFEPVKTSFLELEKRLEGKNVRLVNKAVGNQNTSIEMYTETNNKSQSSSILVPSRHLTDYPNIVFDGNETVEMVRLDDFIEIPTQYNFLNLDVQGYELEVLKGAPNLLENIDTILSEVNFDQLYEDGVLIDELDEYLDAFSFKMVETKWWKKSCWGDALYVNRKDNV
ncbi:MAG: FkbM family methyltransferase [Arenicella sp.]|jgi:FkbM family methyltransferase|nr:FkbM family methyltransferase [Arenicella sp.]